MNFPCQARDAVPARTTTPDSVTTRIPSPQHDTCRKSAYLPDTAFRGRGAGGGGGGTSNRPQKLNHSPENLRPGKKKPKLSKRFQEASYGPNTQSGFKAQRVYEHADLCCFEGSFKEAKLPTKTTLC